MDTIISNTIENLSNNGFNVLYFDSLSEAKSKLLDEISISEDVGIGGSMTVFEGNIHKELMDRGNKVYWHWLVSNDKKEDERKNARNAKVYLSSTNSITEDGKLINIDGVGNRVASMFYGHNRVYIIAGINKIVKDSEEAIKRIKSISCPSNAKRLNLETPCRYTGRCNDCNSRDRMCRVVVNIEKNPMVGKLNIYIVGEELGY